jgi:NTP pyrophosphatase (non-canonical NTP hydrolase)
LREKLIKECGDVLWFVAVLSEYLGYNLADVADMNIEKLQDRAKRGTIQGSGDDR